MGPRHRIGSGPAAAGSAPEHGRSGQPDSRDGIQEILNGLVKDPAREALAQPARRRVRGIAAQPVFTALLLMAASIRKIRAWRALTARGKARITQRARRRRASLPGYLPDG